MCGIYVAEIVANKRPPWAKREPSIEIRIIGMTTRNREPINPGLETTPTELCSFLVSITTLNRRFVLCNSIKGTIDPKILSLLLLWNRKDDVSTVFAQTNPSKSVGSKTFDTEFYCLSKKLFFKTSSFMFHCTKKVRLVFLIFGWTIPQKLGINLFTTGLQFD